MVSAPPNLTELVGRVEQVSPHPSVGKWEILHLRVASTAPIAGWADLVGAQPGQMLEVVIDRDWLPDPAHPARLTGATVRVSASVAGPGPCQGRLCRAVGDRRALSARSARMVIGSVNQGLAPEFFYDFATALFGSGSDSI